MQQNTEEFGASIKKNKPDWILGDFFGLKGRSMFKTCFTLLSVIAWKM